MKNEITLKWGDGSYYSGDVVNEKMHGKGILTYPDGSTYTGDFENGNLHGFGIYKKRDGEVLKGKFTQGKFQKEEEAKTAQDTPIDASILETTSLETEYLNVQDKRNGWSQAVWSSGVTYVGNFEDGCPHGRGTFYFLNGKIVTGEWSHGKLREDDYAMEEGVSPS